MNRIVELVCEKKHVQDNQHMATTAAATLRSNVRSRPPQQPGREGDDKVAQQL